VEYGLLGFKWDIHAFTLKKNPNPKPTHQKRPPKTKSSKDLKGILCKHHRWSLVWSLSISCLRLGGAVPWHSTLPFVLPVLHGAEPSSKGASAETDNDKTPGGFISKGENLFL